MKRKLEDAAAAKDDCAICLSAITDDSKVTLACGHVFHGQCAVTALQMDRRCPICRQKPQSHIEKEADDDLDLEYDRMIDFSEPIVVDRLINKVQPATLQLLLNDFGVPDESRTKRDMAELLFEQLHYETDTDNDEGDEQSSSEAGEREE